MEQEITSFSYYVLLAEDNMTNQLITKSLLRQAGIESIAANNGREAVKLFMERKNIIDLILMDLQMPVMNGYEAAHEIRMISASVPIVAITADEISGVREKCEQSGIFYYISKPFEPDHFLRTITGILSENKKDTIHNVCILDQTTGLKNMGGNPDFYLQVLSEYLKENQSTVDMLSSSISEKRYADAAFIVHKVKSSSASIGAKPLYDAAITLQKNLNEEKEDNILPQTEIFSILLTKLLGEIRELLSR